MTRNAAEPVNNPLAPRTHFHVHSTLGGGYLCECDSHYPLNAAGRDAALREERDGWRDYAADMNSPREGSPSCWHIVIRGSVRSGGFVIDDTESLAWVRYVESWSCNDPACYEGLDD
jgi:hypothetical protein